MGRFFEAMKAGVKGFRSGSDPTGFEIAGRPVRCPHCGNSHFIAGHAMLNTATRTFFKVDWADPSATTLVCDECGRIEWFVNEPDRVD
jgi:predicted nucleic-acid-binding Zn-ribbon protein